jgi:hypothetical protein
VILVTAHDKFDLFLYRSKTKLDICHLSRQGAETIDCPVVVFTAAFSFDLALECSVPGRKPRFLLKAESLEVHFE